MKFLFLLQPYKSKKEFATHIGVLLAIPILFYILLISLMFNLMGMPGYIKFIACTLGIVTGILPIVEIFFLITFVWKTILSYGFFKVNRVL